MNDRRVWVYDIETLKSCFTYTAINIDTEEIVQYVIHKDRDNIVELLNHLNNCKGQIGYNNLAFDYPVIHYFLDNTIFQDGLTSGWDDFTSEEICRLLYKKAQQLIDDQSVFGTAIKAKEVKIPQLDLFKIHHFNNPARSCNLKQLEIAMDLPKVVDMPIHHSKANITLEEVDVILEYNYWDVYSTLQFYKLSLDKIQLRKEIKAKYKLPCTNYSDTKIGEQLALNLYCSKLDLNPYDVKEWRTHRHEIKMSECVFNYINFTTPVFINLLEKIKNIVIVDTKKSVDEKVIYKGYVFYYGTGGIHQSHTPGIYEADDEHVILDIDVGSLYPSIAVKNKLYPEHLGEEFYEIYEDILNQRLEAKKRKDMVISNALKLSLNSIYGKSNSANSFLYDSKYTITTTVNGELLMTMLIEKLLEINLTLLQSNTDGVTLKIKKVDLDNCFRICKEWETKTQLQLEYAEYSKMIIRDVIC